MPYSIHEGYRIVKVLLVNWLFNSHFLSSPHPHSNMHIHKIASTSWRSLLTFTFPVARSTVLGDADRYILYTVAKVFLPHSWFMLEIYDPAATFDMVGGGNCHQWGSSYIHETRQKSLLHLTTTTVVWCYNVRERAASALRACIAWNN
jgi:hypothetical protein